MIKSWRTSPARLFFVILMFIGAIINYAIVYNLSEYIISSLNIPTDISQSWSFLFGFIAAFATYKFLDHNSLRKIEWLIKQKDRLCK